MSENYSGPFNRRTKAIDRIADALYGSDKPEDASGDRVADSLERIASSAENGGIGFPLADRLAKGVDRNNAVVDGAVVEGHIEQNIASGNDAHAEGSGTTASGTQSHAEGGGTIAEGPYSHAEGGGTTASGDNSHAEGSGTTASWNGSHAEGGGTKAIGSVSHAEWGGTTASGTQSHAEGGSTTASGTMSHAEGNSTIAAGMQSHAEGLWTHAKCSSQHVFGEYNVIDTGPDNDRGTYIEIVGNGTAKDSRSNARTLDWSGNEKLAGSITLGMGTADEVTVTAAQLKALLALLQA